MLFNLYVTNMETVEAIAYIGKPKTQGISDPFIFSCNDNNDYIVKFLKDDHLVKDKTLVNELLGNLIAKHIKLPTPECRFVNITSQIIVNSNLSVSAGIHLGIRYLEQADDFNNLDTEGITISNSNSFYGVICFDNFTLNNDRCNKGNNLLEIKDGKGHYYMIDQGNCFCGNFWDTTVLDNNINKRESVNIFEYFRIYLGESIRDITKYSSWIQSIRGIKEEEIRCWIGVNPWNVIEHCEQEKLFELLNYRKNLIEKIIPTIK